jgi:hypothetical protein
MMTNLELAILFHETYERLAPSFGYETRPDTKAFDPESKNGRLMIAVVGEVMDRYDAATTAVEPSAPYIVNPGWTCPKCDLTEAGHIQRECDWKPAEFAQGPVVNRGAPHDE